MRCSPSRAHHLMATPTHELLRCRSAIQMFGEEAGWSFGGSLGRYIREAAAPIPGQTGLARWQFVSTAMGEDQRSRDGT